MSLFIRPIETMDLDALYALVCDSGRTITSLQPDRLFLENQIQRSLASFSRSIEKPVDEFYFFALIDGEKNQLAGVSGIDAAVGFRAPNYIFKVSKMVCQNTALAIRNEYDVLTMVNDFHGQSELCSLLLHPEYRAGHHSRLLSRARLLFMAQYRSRFAERVFAEIRGVSDKYGHSPFWDACTSRFFPMSFSQADRLSALTDKQFIADLMPRDKIPVCLLDEAAQQVIGRSHPESQAAHAILIGLGLSFHNYVDIFDAGPCLDAQIEHVRDIQLSRLVRVSQISPTAANRNDQTYLICNTDEKFRAVESDITLLNEDEVIISPMCANALNISLNDRVRICHV